MAATLTRTIIRKALENQFVGDSISSKKDGSLEVKSTFFYRHGRTPEAEEQKIKAALEAEGIAIDQLIFESQECWNDWPKSSYFSTIIAIRS